MSRRFPAGRLVATWCALLFASAAPAPGKAQIKVIEPGHQTHIVELFRPHGLGGELGDGWRLDSIQIMPRRVEVTVLTPAGASAQLHLLPPDGGRRVGSFDVQIDASSDTGRRAVQTLLRALERNDDGKFWRTTRSAVPGDAPSPEGLLAAGPAFRVAIAANLACLAGCALAGWMLRRRRRRQAGA